MQLPVVQQNVGTSQQSPSKAPVPPLEGLLFHIPLKTVPYISTEPVIEAGALYHPDLLPDHHGDLFQHKHAKLVQQDIKDANETLVAPWQMQEKLCPGTIVVVDATLVCWHIAGKGLARARKVGVIVC
jgi:hypothetical protein